MKKSLLLIGLATLAGLSASAQAATVAHRPHMHSAGAGVFATALGLDNGLLSALNDLLSSNAQATSAAARTCDCSDDPQTSQRLPPPGPTTTVPMATGPLPGTSSAASSAQSSPAPANGGTPPPASSEADLGWQSLLPGSIQ